MKLLNIRPLHLDQLSSMADLTDMQAEVYSRDGAPVAVVLWEGNASRPHSLIRDTGSGDIVRGSLVFDDDIPKHDSRQTYLHVTVNALVRKGESAGIVIRKPEKDAGLYHYEEPPLAVIVSDNAAVPYDAKDMDAAVAYAKQIEQLFAGNLHAFAYETWRLDPCGGALVEMQSITQQEFVANMYSRRTVQGDPVFPQPEGYEANGFTVGHDARVGDDEAWGKLRHLYAFDGVGYASVEFSKAGDKQLVMVKQAEIQETREPLVIPDQRQMAALRAFRDRNGSDWKDKLHQCWMSAKYPGMDPDQAALLQQVRNTSAEWVLEAEPCAFDVPAPSQSVAGEPIVHAIELHGSRSHEMYDEHPGLGSYSTPDHEVHDAPPGCTLTQAMAMAVALYDKANEREHGDFTASSIQLRDEQGGLLQEYIWRAGVKGEDWLRAMPTEAEQIALEAKAAKLGEQANEERRWDNFESGNRLDAQASQIRRDIEIAKAASQPGYPNMEAQAATQDAGERYLVSVNKEHRSAGSTTVEVERQIWGDAELRAAVPQFGIKEASSTNLSDAYVWFVSDESLDGTRFALHVHEIDGREPAEADYRRIADALGIASPRIDVTAEL